MSNEVIPVRSARLARQVGKELEQVQAVAAVEVARVRAAEAVECSKIDALGAAGDTVMREATRLSLVELTLSAAAPQAGARLRLVTDATVVEMVARVHQMNRRLG